MDTAALSNLIGTILSTATASLIVVIADYVLSSLGYSRICLRRNISNGWLAWLPVARYWTIGAIADHYDMRNDIKRRFRFVLLITQIVNIAICIPLIAYAIQLSPFIIEYGIELFTYDIQNAMLLIPFVLGGAGIAVVSTISAVCQIVVFYKIFESTVPKRALIFAIVGAFVPLANSIFVFISRNSGYDYFTDYPDEEEEMEEEVEIEEITEVVEEQ